MAPPGSVDAEDGDQAGPVRRRRRPSDHGAPVRDRRESGWRTLGFTRLGPLRAALGTWPANLLIIDDDLPDGRGGDLVRDIRRDPRLGACRSSCARRRSAPPGGDRSMGTGRLEAVRPARDRGVPGRCAARPGRWHTAGGRQGRLVACARSCSAMSSRPRSTAAPASMSMS